MQSKLPDVNAAIVRHRNAVMIAYDQKDFAKAAISFNAIISLLPDEYKVEINTEKYYNLVKSKHLIKCRYCKTDYPTEDKEGNAVPNVISTHWERGQIMMYPLILTSLEQLMTQQKTMLVWDCPQCKNTQPIIGTEQETVKYQKPVYFKVIPEPPIRHGLHDRINFEQRFKVWYDIVFGELEYQIGLYRAEYAGQNPDADLTGYERFEDKV